MSVGMLELTPFPLTPFPVRHRSPGYLGMHEADTDQAIVRAGHLVINLSDRAGKHHAGIQSKQIGG
jgi:hypothetical protein